MRSLSVFIIAIFCSIVQPSLALDFKWKYLKSEDAFEIEISTSYSGDAAQRYIAVAFSKEPVMENGDGYYCTNTEVKSIALRSKHEAPVVLEDLQDVELKSVTTADETFTCTFIRPMRMTKTISDGRQYQFAFDLEPYNVLMAEGTISDGSLDYHEGSREAKEKIDFSSGITDLINPIDGSLCNTKTCVTDPANCEPHEPSCLFFSIKKKGNRIEMELSGGTGNGQQYVAVAFGGTGTMLNADLYYCDGTRLQSGVIRKRQVRPVDLNDTSVQVVSAATVNGVGQCVFSRAACVTKEVSYGIRKEFDLFKNMHHVLFARGNMTIDGKLLYHEDNRWTTENPVPIIQGGEGEDYQCAAISITPENFDTTKCNESFCMRHPDNCGTSSPDCMFVSLRQENNSFNFDMSGGAGGGREFLAVNFAPLISEQPEDIEIYYCDGKTVKTAILGGDGIPRLSESQMGISNIEAATTNGIGHCSFTRPGCVTRRLSDGELHSYDLFKHEYHIQIGKGRILPTGEIEYRDEEVVAFGVERPIGQPISEEYECVMGANVATTKSAGLALAASSYMMIFALSFTLKSFF